jgi:hypothetical protein
MATCPSGHESASDDFCDVCGMRIGAEALTPSGPGPGGDVCPRCGMSRTGQFCEACGYGFTVGAPDLPPPAAPAASQTAPPAASQPAAPAASQPAPPAASPSPSAEATWTAVVTADRAYYDSVQAAGGPDAAEIRFPAYCPERRFRLSGSEVRVGRRSMSRGITPEIDLTGPPADPGVSRLHAVLVAAQGGTWSVVDPGSENGTLLNGNEIPPGEAVPLHDGDRIHVGAWTALTITRGG